MLHRVAVPEEGLNSTTVCTELTNKTLSGPTPQYKTLSNINYPYIMIGACMDGRGGRG